LDAYGDSEAARATGAPRGARVGRTRVATGGETPFPCVEAPANERARARERVGVEEVDRAPDPKNLGPNTFSAAEPRAHAAICLVSLAAEADSPGAEAANIPRVARGLAVCVRCATNAARHAVAARARRRGREAQGAPLHAFVKPEKKADILQKALVGNTGKLGSY